MSEQLKLTTRGKVVAWGAGLAVAAGIGAGIHEIAKDEPVPLDRQRNIAEKVIEDGKVPDGFALLQIQDGDTSLGIANTYHAKDHRELSDKISDQIAGEAGTIFAGDRVLVDLNDFETPNTTMIEVPSSMTNSPNDSGYIELPSLAIPPEVPEQQ
jgi:hypothetical protein